MTMEEGPPGPMLFRLFWFVSAGVICTMAINKWREMQRQSIQEHSQHNHHHHQQQQQQEVLQQRPKIQSPNSLQSSTK